MTISPEPTPPRRSMQITVDTTGFHVAMRKVAAAFARMSAQMRLALRPYSTGPLSTYPNRAAHARARRLQSWRKHRDVRQGRVR